MSSVIAAAKVLAPRAAVGAFTSKIVSSGFSTKTYPTSGIKTIEAGGIRFLPPEQKDLISLNVCNFLHDHGLQAEDFTPVKVNIHKFTYAHRKLPLVLQIDTVDRKEKSLNFPWLLKPVAIRDFGAEYKKQKIFGGNCVVKLLPKLEVSDVGHESLSQINGLNSVGAVITDDHIGVLMDQAKQAGYVFDQNIKTNIGLLGGMPVILNESALSANDNFLAKKRRIESMIELIMSGENMEKVTSRYAKNELDYVLSWQLYDVLRNPSYLQKIKNILVKKISNILDKDTNGKFVPYRVAGLDPEALLQNFINMHPDILNVFKNIVEYFNDILKLQVQESELDKLTIKVLEDLPVMTEEFWQDVQEQILIKNYHIQPCESKEIQVPSKDDMDLLYSQAMSCIRKTEQVTPLYIPDSFQTKDAEHTQSWLSKILTNDKSQSNEI